MRRYLVFVSASLALLMYSIDSTVVAVAFPSFTKELGGGLLWTAWTMSVFFIGVTMTMPIAGSLSDNFGRKKVFLVSLGLFTLSSLVCGLAPNIQTLVAFRFLQGVGGASFLPTASGIVSDYFPESRERAIGLFTSIFPIGGIIGPNLGGWVVSRYSWRAIFYINIPVGLTLMMLTAIILTDVRRPSRPHVDVGGACLISSAILLLMLAMNIAGERYTAPYVLLASSLLLASVLLVFLFLRQERSQSNPIFDLVLLRSTPFLAANVLNLAIGAGVLGIFAFIPLYATSVHGLSTLMSGVILTPRSVAMIASSAVISFLLHRWGYRWPMVFGLAVAGLSTMLLAPGLRFWGMGMTVGDAGQFSILLLIAGAGMGVLFPAANNACIDLMPQKVATIVALRNTLRAIGGALGVSLITLILQFSRTPARGFTLAFVAFGLALLISIPFALLLPQGRTRWGEGEAPAG